MQELSGYHLAHGQETRAQFKSLSGGVAPVVI